MPTVATRKKNEVYLTTTGFSVPLCATVRPNGDLATRGGTLGGARPARQGGAAAPTGAEPLRTRIARGGRLQTASGRAASARYGRVCERRTLGDGFESDDGDEHDARRARAHNTPARQLIRALEKCRELEDMARRLRQRGGRSLDVRQAESALRDVEARARAAAAAVQRLDSPCEARVAQAAQALRRAWRSRPAMTRAQLARLRVPLPPGPAPHECAAVVRVVPGWYACGDCIRTPADVRRVLDYIATRYDAPWAAVANTKVVPSMAIPACIRTPETATLQNLPAWQHARVALMSRWLVNTHARVPDVRKLARELGVLSLHAETLCRLSKQLRARPLASLSPPGA